MIDPATPVATDISVGRRLPARGNPGEDPRVSATLAGLEFTAGDAPRVSIVVATCGNLALTARCLGSIQAHRPQVSHEVLVIDDASGDAAIAALSQVPGLHYHQTPRNLGFLRSCNAAAALARGEYLFFLDHDAEVTAGWLDAALDVFARFADCGMVGAKLLAADGRLQQAGAILWMDGSIAPVGSGQDAGDSLYNHVREVDCCLPAASMLRTGVFLEAGGFDPAYASVEWASADLALRLRQQRRRVYYCPRTAVVGNDSGPMRNAAAASGKVGHDRHVLRERWGHVLDRRHYRSGKCDFRAREHGRHKRMVLVMDHTIPQPDRDAGSRAMLQTMLQLTRMGLVVKFWPDDHRYGPDYRHLLDAAGIEVLTPHHWGGSFETFIREHGDELDFALLSRPNFAAPYIPLLRRYSRARIVFYGHDLHFLRMLGQAELTGDEQVRAAAEAMREVELGIWRAVDSIIYPSQDEADVVADYVGMAKSHAVPAYSLEHELQARRHPADALELLFVAGFAHPPNVDAAEWLVGSILPEISKQLAGATVHLVGSNPTDRVLALASDAVRISANVSPRMLADHYASAALAIVPLRFGGGVKLKVVEAMAHGIPLVTTSVGAQGLPGVEHCIGVADQVDALVAAVVRLVHDSDHAQRQAGRARDYVRQHYSERSMQTALWRALAGSGETPFAGPG